MRVLRTASVLLLLLVPSLNAEGIKFREVSKEWGIDFHHHHGGSGKRYMVETMVGGVVMFDFDDDGDEDLFFVDGGVLPSYTGPPPRSRLFRNDGGHKFTDWTDRSGIKIASYGAGGSAGDVDNDGDLDLFVTAFAGPDQLFRNNGDGTFTDVTAKAGVGDTLWSSSSAFADVDNDGDLDLYMVSYVDHSVANHKLCGDAKRKLEGYCHPDEYNPLPGRFYRNRGDGTFEDATQSAGFGGAVGPGLGVVFGDIDNDGWQDVFIANDNKPNFLFHNKKDGTFEDVSLISGAGIGGHGRPEAGMGVDMADYDGNGLLDIVVTNYELETNGLYKNLGDVAFVDSRSPAGIAEPSLMFLAFGVDFADLDQDGDPDLVIANGHTNDNAALFLEGSQFAQRNQVFENLGNGKFREDKATGMDVVRVSRGLATGDLDGDGDLDVAIIDSNDPCEVYENVSASGASGNWLQVKIAAPAGNRFGIGARLEVEAGGKRQVDDVRTASSFLSQNALAVHFGLGKNAKVDRLTVRRPGRPNRPGSVQVFNGLPANRTLMIE
ncbi:MAG TPA: CRTAC1 family protein [Thermoanaerobaculia bacterium]|nr:CRTAC1 family protein [Thermoanaerobaculia bacterium]